MTQFSAVPRTRQKLSLAITAVTAVKNVAVGES